MVLLPGSTICIRRRLVLLLLFFLLVIELRDETGALRWHAQRVALSLSSRADRLLLTLETAQDLLSLHACEIVALHYEDSAANLDDVVEFQRMQAADLSLS